MIGSGAARAARFGGSWSIIAIGRNAKLLLITLCIRCHMRLHHSLRLRRWVPEALLGLWRELHPGAPLQLQLPFIMTIASVSAVRAEAQQGRPEAPQPKLALGEKPGEQPFRCAEAFISQDDGFGLANRVGDETLGVQIKGSYAASLGLAT